VVAPLVQVFVDASSGGAGLARYQAVFEQDVSRRALVTTLLDSVVVAVVAIVLGSVIAWTLHTTARRWVRVLLWTAALVPFTMGVIVKNYAILLLLVANGPVNELLQAVGFADRPVQLLYTKFAVVYGLTYSLLPYAVLTLYSVFSSVDRDLLGAASVLGASRARALWTVVLPLVRGGIGVAAALVFVLSIGYYVTPILLGGLQTPFMATVISQQIFIRYDYPGAAAAAGVLLVIALVVVAATLLLAGGRAFRRTLR
jgi:putative spermidine/putrescine transport system permease protein